MHSFKLHLTILFIGLCAGVLAFTSAVRADEIRMPVHDKPPVFIELFSSQACVFCPQADRLFSELVKQKQVYGVSCHIDYFDVRQGSLSRPFCTKRQSWYMQTLRAGPNYTPQMVVNGHHDVVGYKIDEVSNTIGHAGGENLMTFEVYKKDEKNVFEARLPNINQDNEAMDLKLWLLVFDDHIGLTIQEGRNKGKSLDYVHVVSEMQDIGSWDGSEMLRVVSPSFSEQSSGFYIIAQDQATGRIIALGHYGV
jgi:hypothetical protein